MSIASVQPETIRVFLSSTFRDLGPERAALAARAFPRLTTILKARGLVWEEVELRWGIPDEVAKQGQILRQCLDSIDRCRPYFIGILGDGHGSVVEDVPEEMHERLPWLGRRPRSIVDIEFSYGALNAPEEARHAVFYVKASLADLARSGRIQDERLQQLLTRVQESGLPVRTFESPEALADLVVQDFSRIAAEQRVNDDEVIVERLGRDIAARPQEMGELTRWFAGELPVIVIGGPAGIGKTSLVAGWLSQQRATRCGPFDDAHPLRIVFNSCSSAVDSDRELNLNGLVAKLRSATEGGAPNIGDLAESESVAAFHDALSAISATSRPLLLWIDGAEKIGDGRSLFWLRDEVPRSVRIVVSTRSAKHLEEARHWQVATVQVAPLNDSQKKEVAERYLRRFDKALDDARLSRIAAAQITQLPLAIRMMLDELRVVGDHGSLDRLLDVYLSASSLPDLADRILERWDRDYGDPVPGMVQTTLSLLWGSRRGLSEPELFELLPISEHPRGASTWSAWRAAAADIVKESQSILRIDQDLFNEAVQRRYLADPVAVAAIRTRLKEAFRVGPCTQSTQRSIEEVPWQLANLREWPALIRLLTDDAVIILAWRQNRDDLVAIWRMIEKHSDERVESAYGAGSTAMGNRDAVWAAAALLRRLGRFKAAASLMNSSLVQRDDPEDARNSPLEEALSLGEQGALHLLSGNTGLASRDSMRAEAIFQAHGLSSDVASVRMTRAMALHREGRFADALRFLDGQGSTQFAERDRASFLINRAAILRRLGRREEALEAARNAEGFARRFGDQQGVGRALASQGAVYHDAGDLELAIACEFEAVSHLEQSGDADDVTIVLGNLAMGLRDAHRGIESIPILERMERSARRAGNDASLAQSLFERASRIAEGGDPKSAIVLFQETTEIFTRLNDWDKYFGARLNEGMLHAKVHDITQAVSCMDEVAKLALHREDFKTLELSVGKKALLLLEADRIKEGMEAFDELQLVRQIAQDARNRPVRPIKLDPHEAAAMLAMATEKTPWWPWALRVAFLLCVIAALFL